jgi:hypothetical protein
MVGRLVQAAIVVLLVLIRVRQEREAADRRRSEGVRQGHLSEIGTTLRRIPLQLSRMEHSAHNRRALELMTADHPFVPLDEDQQGAWAECSVDDCIVPRRQHRFEAGESVIGSVEMADRGRFIVRDLQGTEATVYWVPPTPETEARP